MGKIERQFDERNPRIALLVNALDYVATRCAGMALGERLQRERDFADE